MIITVVNEGYGVHAIQAVIKDVKKLIDGKRIATTDFIFEPIFYINRSFYKSYFEYYQSGSVSLALFLVRLICLEPSEFMI
jgi:hypothetical protein